ncbi:MAG: hypothetical protein GF308_08230 [Candidatus Heimdallarchaeota archaeon]|nr:hypothetical protein [Candidatus Heimdallarchaeota archaeon]
MNNVLRFEELKETVLGTVFLPTEAAIATLRAQTKLFQDQLQDQLQDHPPKNNSQANKLFKMFIVLYLGCSKLLQSIGFNERTIPVEFVCPPFTCPTWLQAMKGCLFLSLKLYDQFVSNYFFETFVNVLNEQAQKNLAVFIRYLRKTKSQPLQAKKQLGKWYLYQQKKKERFGVKASLIIYYSKLDFEFYKLQQSLRGATK